jgi:hypothetical protein
MKTNDDSFSTEPVAANGALTRGQPPGNHKDGTINPVPVNTVVAEINRLHEEARKCSFVARESLHEALAAAWRAGQLLLAERKRVRHCMGRGAWLLWLQANFRGTPRTAQRYMKLARCVADVDFLQGMSLRQTYARLGIATEPKTPGKCPLIHQLPPYVVLANKLLRALKRPPGATVEEQREAYRRDLRVLYERLRPWFESTPYKTS